MIHLTSGEKRNFFLSLLYCGNHGNNFTCSNRPEIIGNPHKMVRWLHFGLQPRVKNGGHVPVVKQPWGVYVAGQVGKKGTEFLLKLLATVLVVGVFQAVVGHQIGAACQFSLFWIATVTWLKSTVTWLTSTVTWLNQQLSQLECQLSSSMVLPDLVTAKPIKMTELLYNADICGMVELHLRYLLIHLV